MNHKQVTEKLLDLLDGSLDEHTSSRLNEHLESCSECVEALNEYRKLLSLERALGVEFSGETINCVDEVMEKIKEEDDTDYTQYAPFSFFKSMVIPIGAVASVCLVLIVFILNSNLSTNQTDHTAPPIMSGESGVPVAKLDLSTPTTKSLASAPSSSEENELSIPAGYRAVNIPVDARSAVEGFSTPGTRVDILWTFNEDGKNKTAVLERFIKVLSTSGNAMVDSVRDKITYVTLLVSEKVAKKIELAKSMGELSLSLVGSNEHISDSSIKIMDLVGAEGDSDHIGNSKFTDGVMYTTDASSGKQVRYILLDGKWTIDKEH